MRIEVEALSKRLAECESRFYSAITNAEASSPSPIGHHGLHRSEQELTRQDEENQLDHILGTATHLKEIGYEINEEIGVHVRLLDEISLREDEILEKQQRNEKLLRQWMASRSGSFIWTFVAILFLTLVYVLMW